MTDDPKLDVSDLAQAISDALQNIENSPDLPEGQVIGQDGERVTLGQQNTQKK